MTTTPAAGTPQEMSAEDALLLLSEGKTIQNVYIRNLTLTGKFEHALNFQNVVLKGLKLSDATLNAGLNFKSCVLERPTLGSKVVIANDLDLRGSTLVRATFGEVQVGGSLRMDNVVTDGLLRFHKCQFGGVVRVWQARFTGWVEFHNCVFKNKADLRSFHAEEGVQAKGCVFEDDVLFRGSTVSKKFDLGDSRFDALLDFSKAKLRDVTYLETIEQGPKQAFCFCNALFDRMLIRCDQLTDRIAAENAKHFTDAAAEYGLLKRNFQILNRYEDEDWAFYRFKLNQRRGRKTTWVKPWTKSNKLFEWLFLDLGCGYGAKPFRAVTTAAVLILFFAALYFIGADKFDVSQAPLEQFSVDHPVNRALFGLLTSVSVFTAGFTGEHLSQAQGWALLPLATEALLGTLLWGLFIVAFSRKVIR